MAAIPPVKVKVELDEKSVEAVSEEVLDRLADKVADRISRRSAGGVHRRVQVG